MPQPPAAGPAQPPCTCPDTAVAAAQVRGDGGQVVGGGGRGDLLAHNAAIDRGQGVKRGEAVSWRGGALQAHSLGECLLWGRAGQQVQLRKRYARQWETARHPSRPNHARCSALPTHTRADSQAGPSPEEGTAKGPLGRLAVDFRQGAGDVNRSLPSLRSGGWEGSTGEGWGQAARRDGPGAPAGASGSGTMVRLAGGLAPAHPLIAPSHHPPLHPGPTQSSSPQHPAARRLTS